MDPGAAFAIEKGAPLTADEQRLLRERADAARAWLENYAPESARIEVQEALPPASLELTASSARYLRRPWRDALASAGMGR